MIQLLDVIMKHILLVIIIIASCNQKKKIETNTEVASTIDYTQFVTPLSEPVKWDTYFPEQQPPSEWFN